MNFLKDTFPQVPIIALTATATEKVRSDIVESLKMRNPKCFITSFNRPNISYEIRYKDILHNPYEDLRNFLNEHAQECGIIYCRTRNQVDELVLQLSMEKDKGGKDLFSCKSYHAGLKLSERKTVQTDWLKGKTKIIVGTIAYGMGIDKKDVRFVVVSFCEFFIILSLEPLIYYPTASFFYFLALWYAKIIRRILSRVRKSWQRW